MCFYKLSLQLLFVFVVILFPVSEASYNYVNFEAKKKDIIKEIDLTIPKRDTITYTQVPRGIILSVAQFEFFNEYNFILSKNGESLLDGIAKLLKTFDNSCTIEVHTEENILRNPNVADKDWEYSVVRSNVIADYLVKIAGVKTSQVFPIGFGNIMPFKDNVSKKDFYNNRIDFVIFDYSVSR